MSMVEDFDRAVASAQHLTDDRFAAAISAARALARKADAWDEYIVRWANADAEANGGRPVVPVHDNVTLSAYFKALEVLGLTPVGAAKLDLARFGRPAPSKPANGGDDDDDDGPVSDARITDAQRFRERAAARQAATGNGPS